MSCAPPETERRCDGAVHSRAGGFAPRPRRHSLNSQDFRRAVGAGSSSATGHRGALPHFLSCWVIQRYPQLEENNERKVPQENGHDEFSQFELDQDA